MAIEQKTRREYTKEERDAVLADVKKMGVCAAARKHGIPQTSVSNWLRRGQQTMTSTSKESTTPVAPVRERSATTSSRTPTSRVARSYTPSQKALILEDAAKDGVTEASKKHDVSRFSI